MKNETKCPKCGSTEIKRRELHLMGKWASITAFDVYVCQKCRYSEFYIRGKKK